jgi:integrase/recombinase XerD
MATERKPKAPSGCFWREGTLWGCAVVRGKKYRWSLRTNSVADAKARFKAGRDRLVAESFHPEGIKRTLLDALEKWEAFLDERGVRPSTRKRYLVSLGQLQPHLEDGRIALADIRNTRLRDLVRSRRATGAEIATVKRDLVALSSVLNCAVAEGWLEANPVLTQLRNLKERHDPIVLPAAADVALITARCHGMMADLVRIAAATGARESELLNLKRSDIDFERGQLTLRGKGGKTRVIDLYPFDALALFRGLPAYGGSQVVFWHDDGQPYRNFASGFRATVRRTIAWASETKVPFRPFRFHDLRHLHAVEWLKAGRDIYALQKRLGHSSLKVTEIYLTYLTHDEELVAKHGERRIAK